MKFIVEIDDDELISDDPISAAIDVEDVLYEHFASAIVTPKNRFKGL